jgi:hypothetical protein
MKGTITLSEPKIFNVAVFGAEFGIEDLVFSFPHSKGQIWMDSTPTHIKIQELHAGQYRRISK